MSCVIEGDRYAMMYGPTKGDRIRLADTELVIQIEKDFTTYGDEVKFGGGKSIRDGMGQNVNMTSGDGCLDLVITNCVILDYTGIYKADIGIKDGRIAGIGKAGNPDIMDGVTEGMVIGASTEALAGENLIGVAAEEEEHLQFLGRHFQLMPRIGDGIAADIDRQPGEGDFLRRRVVAGLIAPVDGLDARDKLLRLEGLNDVIVRAELEAEHAVERFALGGKHDDGKIARAADFAADLPAVHAGQHDIQQHQMRRVLAEHIDSRIAAIGGFDLVAFFFQIKPHQLHDIRIVVHQKNSRSALQRRHVFLAPFTVWVIICGASAA